MKRSGHEDARIRIYEVAPVRPIPIFPFLWLTCVDSTVRPLSDCRAAMPALSVPAMRLPRSSTKATEAGTLLSQLMPPQDEPLQRGEES